MQFESNIHNLISNLPLNGHSDQIDWKFDCELEPLSLRQYDPIELLQPILEEHPELEKHKGRLHTIVTELFSNSLEHGLLGISSELKNSIAGLGKYYVLRDKLLEELEEGYIHFSIKHYTLSSESILQIVMEDSGKGFSKADKKPKSRFCGRGIPIVNELCDSVRHNEVGNKVEVLYRL